MRTEKLTSIGQLEWLRNRVLSDTQKGRTEIHVCMTGCRAYGAADVAVALSDEVRRQSLQNEVEIRATGCHGFCAKAPVVAIEPMGVQYQAVAPEDAPEIISQTVRKNQLIERLAYQDPR